MKLAAFPRVSLTDAPTRLQALPRLSRLLGGPDIYIKRDDNTGLAQGGNKTRKLEFLIGDALARGATHLVTHGARQSNHVRQTAAAAAQFGLGVTILLEDRVSNPDADYEDNGNVLLDRVFGARIERRPPGLDMNRELEPVAEQLRAQGKVPYLIPGGGSNAIGALGYVNAAQELLQQIHTQRLSISHIVHASGSSGTQAGLLVGLRASGGNIPVLGISVRAARERQIESVVRLARSTWDTLDLNGQFPEAAVEVTDDYVGPGYGIPDSATLDALLLLARTEGILLDPVYTAKGFAGLLGEIRAGRWRPGQSVIFLHTGGTSALAGYRDSLSHHANTYPA